MCCDSGFPICWSMLCCVAIDIVCWYSVPVVAVASCPNPGGLALGIVAVVGGSIAKLLPCHVVAFDSRVAVEVVRGLNGIANAGFVCALTSADVCPY